MKRLLIIILLLITPVVSHAQAIDWTKPFQLAANIDQISGKPWANVDQVSGKAKANIQSISGANKAAAASSTFCSSTTQTTNGTTVRVCEDFDAAQECWTGSDPDICRWTWTVSGTITYTAGNDGVVIDGAAAGAETFYLDSGAASTTLGGFAKVKILAFPATAGNIKSFMTIGDTTARCIAELKSDGTLSVYAATRTSSIGKVSTGDNYFWIYYDDSSGSSDGTCYACFSTTTTKPDCTVADCDPVPDNCAFQYGHNVTTDSDRLTFTNGYSTTFNSYEIYQALISTSEIGSNP